MVFVASNEVVTDRGLRLLFDPADTWIANHIRENDGVWERSVTDAIVDCLQPGWTFLDIGAHVGYFSLLAAQKGNPVIAIEADPDMAALLEQNAALNGLDVEAVTCAVADYEGHAYLALDESQEGNLGAAYLSDKGKRVRVMRLKDVLAGERPDFIKVDIEGLEYAVLKDSLEILDAAKVLIVEVCHSQLERYGATIPDLVQLLINHGFIVTYMDGTQLDYRLGTMSDWQYTNLLARRPAPGEQVQTGILSTVLLCAWRSLTVETAECMLQLRDKGWGYKIVRGDALIQRSRSRAVSNWYLNTQDDVFLMIDDDVVFEIEGAEKVVKLAREKRSIAVGAYPVKDGGHLACRGYVGQELIFGEGIPPVEIQWPATGFMAVHRDVIKALIAEVPFCGAKGDERAFWPLFDTFWITDANGNSEYLSEDYAFGERARRLGFKTWLESTVILFHLGQYPYNVHNMPKARHFERSEDEVPSLQG